MSERSFFDTNVLVYAFGDADPRKDRAIGLLSGGGIVSVQVLNEFVDVARRRLRRDWRSIGKALDIIGALVEPPVALTVDLHRDAVDLSERRGFRIYDSLILVAAKRAGCRLIYSEDMQDGQTVDGVLIRNPFAEA